MNGYMAAIPGIIVLLILSIPFWLLGTIFFPGQFSHIVTIVFFIFFTYFDKKDEEKVYYLTLNPFCNPYIFGIISAALYAMSWKLLFVFGTNTSRENWDYLIDWLGKSIFIIQLGFLLGFIFYRKWLKKNEIPFQITLNEMTVINLEKYFKEHPEKANTSKEYKYLQSLKKKNKP